jgi:hypothetical protein
MNDVPSHDRWRMPVGDSVNEIDPKYFPEDRREGRPRWGDRLLGLGVLLALGGALAVGGWRHYLQQRETVAVVRAAQEFRSSFARGDGQAGRRNRGREASGDHLGIHCRERLRARQWLHRQALRGHRRCGKERATAGRDHRARA